MSSSAALAHPRRTGAQPGADGHPRRKSPAGRVLCRPLGRPLLPLPMIVFCPCRYSIGQYALESV